MKRIRASVRLLPLAVLACGCGRAVPEQLALPTSEKAGGLAFRMQSPADAVVGFRFVVSSDGQIVQQRDEMLETETLPAYVIDSGADGQRFADAYFVLPPGLYDVEAVPLVEGPNGLIPSADCIAGEARGVEVQEGDTTEITTVARCNNTGNGGLDVIAVVNHAPTIEDLVFDPSKFVVACEPLTVTIAAEDADPLQYDWQIVAPPGAVYESSFADSTLQFVAETPGEYEAMVTVCDAQPEPYTMCTSLTFPIHVSLGSDEDGDRTGDLCGVSIARLGDFVWSDNDRDGLQGIDEVGLPAVEVTLYTCGGALVATTQTGSDGRYLFDGLAPGEYYLHYDVPDGAVVSPQARGNDAALDSDADPTTHQTTCMALASGDSDLSWDVGIHHEPELPCGECDGRVVDLTLQYFGDAAAPVYVYEGKKQKEERLLFEGAVEPLATFSFGGLQEDGTMGTEISVWIGDEMHTRIHTSCSQPIGPGLNSGDFAVIAGQSQYGGPLCPVATETDDQLCKG